MFMIVVHGVCIVMHVMLKLYSHADRVVL